MYRNWASREEVTEYLTWPAHADVGVTRELLQNWTSSYDQPDFYNWAIELKETGEIIGGISVVHIDERCRSADLGYCMGPQWWGQGIMAEAGRAVVSYLFDEVGFNRIAAAHAKDNPRSGRVMQKMGMTYEGTWRQGGWCNADMIDAVWYSILRSDTTT